MRETEAIQTDSPAGQYYSRTNIEVQGCPGKTVHASR